MKYNEILTGQKYKGTLYTSMDGCPVVHWRHYLNGVMNQSSQDN